MNTNSLPSRRDVLKGGALVVSFSWLGLAAEVFAQTAVASTKDTPNINCYEFGMSLGLML
jgi:hypothetical protein